MEYRRNSGTYYSEDAIRAVIDLCEVEVVTETTTHFMLYCPFHGNTDSPSFVIQKDEQGLFNCFNPSCEERGNLNQFVKKVKGCNELEAARIILKASKEHARPISEIIAKRFNAPPTFVKFEVDFDDLHEKMWGSPAHEYMKGRGFEDSTLAYFKIGYSQLRDMVIVPMYSPDDLPIGLIGRAIQEKRFKNSTGLPKKETLWNFNNAKKSDRVILVESSFDAMRIHQAGFSGAVATLGPIGPRHFEQINRTFNSVIIMTDDDKKEYRNDCAKCRRDGSYMCYGHQPGLELGKKIAEGTSNKKVYWANYGDTRFPKGCKDASDMTDDQIRQCINGSATSFELKMKYGTDVT